MRPDGRAYSSHSPWPLSPGNLVLVLLLHVLVIACLAAHDIAPRPIVMENLMVQVLSEKSLPPVVRPLPVAPVVPRTKNQPVLAPPILASAAAPTASDAVPMRQPVVDALPESSAPAAEHALSPPRFEANYLNNPAPAYPAISRRMGEEGRVLLRVYVEPAGLPSRIELKSSSGSQRLDQAAEHAVWHWRFIPAKRGNEAVAAWVVVPIQFNLRG